MHTVAVTDDGKKVFTFGCNDELALGRNTAVNGKMVLSADGSDASMNDTAEEVTTEQLEATPTAITIPAMNIVKLTAGDSHTAALTGLGAVYCWGCFRVSCALKSMKRQLTRLTFSMITSGSKRPHWSEREYGT